MKRLTLTRTSRKEGHTLGILHQEGELLCYTLEPQWRDLKHEEKVKGKTAIPEGTYRIRLLPSRKFKRMMPYLMDVPHFTGVMIHPGNRVTDTKGCILVGERDGHDTLKHSRLTFNKVYALIAKAEQSGESVEIKIE